MSARAGIVVTGTEVLTGRVTDRNGPWLAERLRELGVDVAHTVVTGDRPSDLVAALEFLSGLDVVVTSGGLGPTEDDLTARVVGDWQDRPSTLDEALQGRIATILERLTKNWQGAPLDRAAIDHGVRKQAFVPDGATVLEPVGTAPGLVVPPSVDGRPTVVVLPGPPRELQGMWPDAIASDAFRRAVASAEPIEQRMLRMFGIPESEIAETLRVARSSGVDVDALEITTCLRRGEVEVVTRFAPALADVYAAFDAVVRERHADTLFSDDGRSVDELVADGLRARGWTIAVAESCTGGLLGGRLTERAGSSAYVAGGVIVYSNEAKVALAGVSTETLAAFGAVSVEVARELARGARAALGADVGVGVTGVAGPGGGTPDKPVGTVCFSVAGPDGGTLTRRLHLPGSRVDVRDRSTTVALHLVLRLLGGDRD